MEWLTLLGMGLSRARDGRADTAPFLSEVMWEGVSRLPRFPRPALLDHPFRRSALDRNEDATIAYLNDRWTQAWLDPLPLGPGGVLQLPDSPDCLTAGQGAHYMTNYGASFSEGLTTWYTGLCASCMRVNLRRIDP